MRLLSISFLMGTLPFLFLDTVPSLSGYGLVLVLLILLGGFCAFKFNKSSQIYWSVVGMLFGFLVAGFSAQNILDQRLDATLQGRDIVIQGSVIGIPDNRNDGTRFRFLIEKAKLLGKSGEEIHSSIISLKGIVRLGWFKAPQSIKAGESWQLMVRLKRPSGFLNPGGFDYEKWLFTERIIATGYIRSSVDFNQRSKAAPWWSLDHWRESIHQNIQQNVTNKAAAAVLSALVVANRSDLSDKQWQQLQQTGTNHLIAISGLHIAIVAAFGFLPMMLIWRLFPRLNERWPLKISGSISGGVLATIYAMLAGFTLPTQRALVMVIIALVVLYNRRFYTSSKILAFALLAVLLIDPLAAMTVSFWLSFVAVMLILLFLNRQIKRPTLQLVKMQVWLSLAMIPLTLLFFGSASLTSPVANLFAIPWVSLVVVPLSLLALVFMPISLVISKLLFNISAIAIDWLFSGLNYLSQSPLASLNPASVPLLYLLLSFVGLLFWVLPKGFPGRWLGVIALMPALFFYPDKPMNKEFSFTLLDVGQGMASVVQTANYSLIYDSGTRMSDTFDIGKLVVIPYLRSKGISKIDMMIISHEDIDHRGGAKYIAQNMNINKIISSDLDILPSYKVDPCIKGMKWQWDGVDFEMMSPPADYEENDNNRSCVLRISNHYHSLLLTADIQNKTEAMLVDSYQNTLASEVITVPHHGSKTSSSLSFINQVSPRLALITAGYRSRFGHPKKLIVERYLAQGVTLMDTVKHGAIRIDFPSNNKGIKTSAFREKVKGIWSRQ